MTTKICKTPVGKYKGNQGDHVVQFLGIKYASLKDRLSAPEMILRYDREIIDATLHGPRCIGFEGCEFETSVLIQQRIDIQRPAPMSGTEGLNLNITVPDIHIDRPIPVMVFIHGGGFLMGANWWPHYDPARLVKLSIQSEIPVIAINFNYRIGVYGNLTSEELRNVGYPGNNSLRDQRCALQWIKSHIRGFGGDPENILVFGESAGAASTLYHLSSEVALFKRAISMSGTPIMLKPLSPSCAELSFSMIMKELGMENNSPEERLKKLLTVDLDELVSKTPMTIPMLPFIDGDIVPSTTSFTMLSRMKDSRHGSWDNTELMVGNCKHDGTIFLYQGLAERKSGIAQAFHSSLQKNLSDPRTASLVLAAYLIHPSTDDETAIQSIFEFATDIAYHLPAVAYAKSFSGKSFFYQFNQPNPWPGNLTGKATHLLDAAFLFQNYNEKLETEARNVAIAMAKDFIRLANGHGAWEEEKNSEEEARVYGPNLEEGGNRLLELNLGTEELDELSRAWDEFLAGQETVNE